MLLPANSVFGIYTLAVEVNNLSLFLKYAVDVVFILRPHFIINVSKSTFGTKHRVLLHTHCVFCYNVCAVNVCVLT